MIPNTLFVRLAPRSLGVARYELRETPIYSYAPCPVRVDRPLLHNLREACQREPLLHGEARQTQVVVVGRTTAVPLAEFQEECCQPVYDYLFTPPVRGGRRTFYDLVPGLSTALVFALDEASCQAVQAQLGEVHYISAQTAVLRHFATKASRVDGPCVYLHLHEQLLDLVAFDNGRAALINTFELHGKADIAYYVLTVLRTTGLPTAQTEVFVAGTPAERDEACQELRRFLPKVWPINPSGEYNRHPLTQQADVPYDILTLLLES